MTVPGTRPQIFSVATAQTAPSPEDSGGTSVGLSQLGRRELVRTQLSAAEFSNLGLTRPLIRNNTVHTRKSAQRVRLGTTTNQALRQDLEVVGWNSVPTGEAVLDNLQHNSTDGGCPRCSVNFRNHSSSVASRVQISQSHGTTPVRYSDATEFTKPSLTMRGSENSS